MQISSSVAASHSPHANPLVIQAGKGAKAGGPLPPDIMPQPKPFGAAEPTPMFAATNSESTGRTPQVAKPMPASTITEVVGQCGGTDHAPPTTTMSSQLQPHEMTLDELIKSWGQSDSVYDLNNDGTVDVSDLRMFINNWNKFNQPAAPAEPAAAVPPGASDIKVNDPTEPVIPDADDAVAKADDANPADAADDVATSTPNIQDFLTSLRSGDSGGKSKVGGLNGAAARALLSQETLAGKAAVKGFGGLQTLTDKLFNHLSGAGFTEQPPVNVRDLIDELNLSPRQTDFVVKQLAGKYPNGLGVNVVG